MASCILHEGTHSNPSVIKKDLRVLTLNCCLLPSKIYQSPGQDNREQRVELIKKIVQRYDVVLLQEVMGTGWCQQWREALSNVPGMHSLLSTKGKGKITDSGLVILSKYPIGERSFTRFKSKGISNVVVDRGFLYAQVVIGNKKLNVVNTHLNPSETHLGFRSAAEYRRRQVKEILAFKKEREEEGDWVIGGDFNDEEVVHLLSPMHITYNVEKIPTSHSQVDFAIRDNEPHLCIDYLTSTNPHTYYRRLDTLISDHFGVEAGILL